MPPVAKKTVKIDRVLSSVPFLVILCRCISSITFRFHVGILSEIPDGVASELKNLAPRVISSLALASQPDFLQLFGEVRVREGKFIGLHFQIHQRELRKPSSLLR